MGAATRAGAATGITIAQGLGMRLLILLGVMVSSSSCAIVGVVVGISSVTVAANAPDRRGAYWRDGVERERRYREQIERDATVARERYRASQRQSEEPARAGLTDGPTPPPLVPFEPARRPLVPR